MTTTATTTTTSTGGVSVPTVKPRTHQPPPKVKASNWGDDYLEESNKDEDGFEIVRGNKKKTKKNNDNQGEIGEFSSGVASTSAAGRNSAAAQKNKKVDKLFDEGVKAAFSSKLALDEDEEEENNDDESEEEDEKKKVNGTMPVEATAGAAAPAAPTKLSKKDKKKKEMEELDALLNEMKVAESGGDATPAASVVTSTKKKSAAVSTKKSATSTASANASGAKPVLTALEIAEREAKAKLEKDRKTKKKDKVSVFEPI